MKTEQEQFAEEMDNFIHEHLSRFGENNLFRASLDHFRDTGKPSGSLRASLHVMLKECTSLKTKSLQDQLEAKEKEIDIKLQKQAYNLAAKDVRELLHNKIVCQWETDFGSIHNNQQMDAYTVSGFMKKVFESLIQRSEAKQE